MIVTATEFKEKLGKYLALAETTEIVITKKGRGVAVLTGIRNIEESSLSPLRGIIRESSATAESIREERLAKHHEYTP